MSIDVCRLLARRLEEDKPIGIEHTMGFYNTTWVSYHTMTKWVQLLGVWVQVWNFQPTDYPCQTLDLAQKTYCSLKFKFCCNGSSIKGGFSTAVILYTYNQILKIHRYKLKTPEELTIYKQNLLEFTSTHSAILSAH